MLETSPPVLSSNSSRWILIAICAAFLLVRVPVMYRQPGGQDEDCYAVPGLMCLRTGIPSLPHVPARNPESVYYRADEAIFSEPPLYFYYQALFYAVLPDVYGTARLATGFSAVMALVLIYSLANSFGCSRAAALWAAGLCSLSRWVYFPALFARPDVLCVAFGFLGIATMSRWRDARGLSWPLATGVCIGLGGLTHPFAVVYALQLAVWAAVVTRGWRRIGVPLLMAGVSILVVVVVWGPLIWKFPEAFQVQFRNQFLVDSEDSLIQRLVMPGRSLGYHFLGSHGMIAHLGIWQTLLAGGPAVWCLVRWLRDPVAARQIGIIAALGVSSVYWMSVVVGPHHHVIGYWAYTGGLMLVCTGQMVDDLIVRVRNRVRWGGVVVAVAVVCSLLPGAGLRTLLVHLREWNNPNYNAPLFAQRLIDSLPDEDAVYSVDTQFTLDFIVRGRKTLLAQTMPMYFRLDQFQFDYLLISRFGTDTKLASQLPVRLLHTVGVREDPFACYCEIYSARKPE